MTKPVFRDFLGREASMGEVVRIEHYRAKREAFTPYGDQLNQLALCHVGHQPRPLRDALERALVAAILHPDLKINQIRLHQVDVVQKLRMKLTMFVAPSNYDNAVQVSLWRLEQETQVDLLNIPFIAAYRSQENPNYRLVRNTLGFIALAWQVMVHPVDIAFTLEDFNRLVARL